MVHDDQDLQRLAAAAADALLGTQAFLATAESCTGGWIAKTLTDLPGSSAWFTGGLVTYSNAAKCGLLGVPRSVIETHGAVSRETVEAMAQGTLACTDADWAIAVSGIAGPTGGSAGKPVGLVWLAWGAAAGETSARSFHIEGDREAVRRGAVAVALKGLVDRIATRSAHR